MTISVVCRYPDQPGLAELIRDFQLPCSDSAGEPAAEFWTAPEGWGLLPVLSVQLLTEKLARCRESERPLLIRNCRLMQGFGITELPGILVAQLTVLSQALKNPEGDWPALWRHELEVLYGGDADELVRCGGSASQALGRLFRIGDRQVTPVQLLQLSRAVEAGLFNTLASFENPGAVYQTCNAAVESLIESARGLKAAAPENAELANAAETLEILGQLFRALWFSLLRYLQSVQEEKDGLDGLLSINAEVDRLADELSQLTGREFLACPDLPGGLGATARQLTRELLDTYVKERAWRREKPGLDPAHQSALIDAVAVGYPGEGHGGQACGLCSVDVNGSSRCRVIHDAYSLTLQAPAGPLHLQVLIGASGTLEVAGNGLVIGRTEWDGESGPTVRLIELAPLESNGVLTVTVRTGSEPARLYALYLLQGSSAPAGE